jgi:TRAP-type transport system small permease protein
MNKYSAFSQRLLDTLLATGTVLALVGMILTVSLQAFARLFLASAPAWTEEAARMCFIYAVAFGAGLGVREGVFVKVDVIQRLLPRHWARLLEGIIWLAVCLLMGFVAIRSLGFVSLGVDQTSPCLRIPMAFIYVSIPIMCSMISLYALLHCLGRFRSPEIRP